MSLEPRHQGVVHTGQHGDRCRECQVARVTWSRGYCECNDPAIEQLALWGTSQCMACGREIRP